MTETLIELPFSKWTTAREAFRENWPTNIVAYCFLDIQLKYIEFYKFLNLKIFCPYGDVSNGIVGISDKEYYQVFIHPLRAKVIEECLKTTKHINWHKLVTVPEASSAVVEILKRISDDIHVIIDSREIIYKHFLTNESKEFKTLSCPPGTHVGPLNSESLDIIDKTWTYSYTGPSTRNLFKLLANNGLTYVLYSSDHKPLAWLTVGTAGDLTHLYCLEHSRRKGYAEFITKYVTNDLLRQNINVLAFTVNNNLPPYRMFQKLGFTSEGWVYWIKIKPK